MAIPVDLRIKKTYRALFDAFTELLEEHRFEDLTVAMLCDRAMKNSPMRPARYLPRTCARFGTRFWTMPWI